MSLEQTIVQLKAAGAALAPSGAAFEVALVDDYLPELSEPERRLVESWAPHRQHEFATGRLCALRARSDLGVEAGNLLPDADGVPLWPEAVVGSISHSRGVAMAVVARSAESSLLGLDLEKTNRLSEGAIKKVVHPLEESFVAGEQLKASILFSLKEAFYKAQFPKWRTTGNFHDLALEVDLARGTANIREMDARFAPELMPLRFGFRVVDDYVVSLCWI